VTCTIRVGEWTVTADIDDPNNADWRAVLTQSIDVGDGDLQIAILGPNGEPQRSARARIIPSREGHPTMLEGLEPFSAIPT
jgi:hypothetical protein